jgi:hypothetical protein
MLLSVLCTHANAQKAFKIPRKLRGIYTGVQPAYAFRSDGKDLRISEISVDISINKHSVNLCFADEKYCPIEKSLDFTLERQAQQSKKRIKMLVRQPSSFLMEEWTFDLKKKELVRTGIFPQPDTRLTKSRKIK